MGHREVVTARGAWPGIGRIKRLALVSAVMIVECGLFLVLLSAAPLLAVSIGATGLATIGALGFLPSYTTLVAFITPPRLRAQAYGWSLLWYALAPSSSRRP